MGSNGMTTTDVAEPGLRERKRLATRRAIQLAVIDLVRERGLDGVTVDEVSRVADISPRTFFNYFASKEDALLGDPPELPHPEVIEKFVHAGPGVGLLESLTELLIDAGEPSYQDADIKGMRQELLREYPELFAKRMATMRKFEGEVAEVIARRLVADDPALASDPEQLDNRSRLVTLVAFAAMRHAWTCWASGEPWSKLEERLVDSFAELKLLFAAGPA